jgi:hypothetical protein
MCMSPYKGGRNHSILLRRISDKSCFDLTVVNEEKRVVDHALLDKRSIRVISKSDKTEFARKDNTRLRYLYRNVIQIERKRSSRNLPGFSVSRRKLE